MKKDRIEECRLVAVIRMFRIHCLHIPVSDAIPIDATVKLVCMFYPLIFQTKSHIEIFERVRERECTSPLSDSNYILVHVLRVFCIELNHYVTQLSEKVDSEVPVLYCSFKMIYGPMGILRSPTT
jgi:hypothetical protein